MGFIQLLSRLRYSKTIDQVNSTKLCLFFWVEWEAKDFEDFETCFDYPTHLSGWHLQLYHRYLQIGQALSELRQLSFREHLHPENRDPSGILLVYVSGKLFVHSWLVVHESFRCAIGFIKYCNISGTFPQVGSLGGGTNPFSQVRSSLVSNLSHQCLPGILRKNS